MTGYRDGRGVIQLNSFPDTKQFLRVTNFSESGGCSLSGLTTVQENFDKRDKKAQITFPLRHISPLQVVK
jgi:hypothetical protein